LLGKMKSKIFQERIVFLLFAFVVCGKEGYHAYRYFHNFMCLVAWSVGCVGENCIGNYERGIGNCSCLSLKVFGKE